MGNLYDTAFHCPDCGGRREMRLSHRISGDEDFLDKPLAAIDIPPLAIVRGRNGNQRLYLELTGDKHTFLQFH
jgi:hypothetical protein